MGREAQCVFEHGGRRFEGRALLEARDIQLRAEGMRASVPLSAVAAVSAADGWLELKTAEGATRLQLGREAEKWADRITSPPSVMDKLGVGAGGAVRLVGPVATELREQIQARGARVVRRTAAAAVILLAADDVAGLGALAGLRAEMADDAAVWVVWPKGRRELTETHVRAAALAAGLVDVKVASVSEVLSGLKLVIRRADRAAGRKKR